MGTFEDLDEVIQANLPQFKKPATLTVRPGYKIRDGWITTEPAIVVTVRQKKPNVSPEEAIPAQVGGVPTDVREATTIQKLRFNNPQQHANIVATTRPEYKQPEFDLERDAQTGRPLKATPASPTVAQMTAKPRICLTIGVHPRVLEHPWNKTLSSG